MTINNSMSINHILNSKSSTMRSYQHASRIFVDGNYAYVTASNGNALEIVDVTNKAAPGADHAVMIGILYFQLR